MSFLFPTFLIALATAAIPVVIHLFNFRSFRRLRFTNVKILQAIQQETDSRSKLKNLLILAARVLALTFLVLAFARPYIPLGAEGAATSEESRVYIYIDNSYSMAVPGKQGTLLDQSLRRARQIASSYPLSTRFQLLTNDFKGEHRRWVSRDGFFDLLEEVPVTPAVRTLDKVLLRMKDGFGQEPGGNRQAYIISDFQTNFIPAPPSPAADSTFRLSLVKLSGAEIANVAIDSAWFIAPAHQDGSLERLVVRIRNYSDKEVANVPLKLTINGVQEALSNVSLLRRARLNDTLVFRSGPAGWKRATLSITDYPITFDDNFYFSYRVAPQVKVLLIDGKGAGSHLRALFGGDDFIDLSVNGEDNVNYGLIAENDLLILNGLSQISSGLAGRIASFVEEGGHLAIFPAIGAEAESYNNLLARLRTDTYSGISRQANQVVRLNLEQDLFRDVFERMPRNPDLPAANRYYRLNKSSRSLKEDLMIMRGNDPLLTKYSSGSGAVYLSAVPLDESESNLPRHALFVPVLYRMALLSIQDFPLYYTIGTDQSVQAGTLDISTGNPYRIRKEGFEIIPVVRSRGAGSEIFVSDQIREPGNYTLNGAGGQELGVFAFNSEQSESDLTYFQAEALEDMGLAGTVTEPEAASLAGMGAVENRGIQLWKYCVVLALIFLAAEVILIKTQ